MAKHLVFQTAFIGDVLLSIPLIKAIREFYPDDEIEIFCRAALKPFFESSELVDTVIVADKSNAAAWKKSLLELKNRQYEIVFCPHESFRSARAVKSLKAQTSVGYSRWWNFAFFDKRVQRPMHLPEALRQLSLLSAVNADFRKVFNQYLLDKRVLSADNRESFKISFPEGPECMSMSLSTKLKPRSLQCTVGLAPGSVWNTKKWPYYLELAEHYIKTGTNVVLLGSPQEKEMCDQIEKHIAKPELLRNVCGQGDLWQAYKEIEGLDLLFSNDSGLMHLACVANTPVVSVFGPTTPDLGYQPWSHQAVVVQKDLNCRPCGKHGHKKCPIGTHECMKSIKVSDVLEAAKFIS